jgi:hypothetical protein
LDGKCKTTSFFEVKLLKCPFEGKNNLKNVPPPPPPKNDVVLKKKKKKKKKKKNKKKNGGLGLAGHH